MPLVLPTSKHWILPRITQEMSRSFSFRTLLRRSERQQDSEVNVDGKGVILKGTIPSPIFKQGKPVKGNPAIESTYQGVTYLFASAADKADFDKDPAKYVPQYGGFCAYGVANGVLRDIRGLRTPSLFTRASFTSAGIRTR